MRGKELLYIVGFVLILSVAILSTKMGNSADTTSTKEETSAQIQLVQLGEKGRQNAATMGLVGAPPMQPKGHEDRWNPEQHHNSCLACHSNPQTGAPTPPNDHYYDNDNKGKVFRDYCIQCHAEQKATNPAFNIKN